MVGHCIPAHNSFKIEGRRLVTKEQNQGVEKSPRLRHHAPKISFSELQCGICALHTRRCNRDDYWEVDYVRYIREEAWIHFLDCLRQ